MQIPSNSEDPNEEGKIKGKGQHDSKITKVIVKQEHIDSLQSCTGMEVCTIIITDDHLRSDAVW